ncbi:MAG: YCF48-related protein [Bacteroidia bacterium]
MKHSILSLLLLLSAGIASGQWRNASPYNGDVNDIVFADALTGFATGSAAGVGSCTGSGSIIRTIDGGKNWLRMNTGSNAAMNRLHVQDKFTVYAVGASSTVIKTTDGGQSWTTLTTGVGAGLNAVHFAPASQTGYVVGPNGILRKSTNGGASWSTISSGVTGTLFDVFFLNPSTGFIAGPNGVIRKTTNGGSSWTSIFSGTDYIKQIWFADANIGFALSPNKIFRTTDGGASWQSWDVNPATILHRFNFLDALNGYATADPNTLLWTHDGGQTWSSQTVSATSTSFIVAYFLNTNRGYLAGGNGRISITHDGGLTWTNQTSGLATTMEGMDFIDSRNGVMAGLNGEIYRTQNGALNMMRSNYTGGLYISGIKYLTESLILASADSGTVLRSTDGGLNWQEISTGAQETLYDIVAVDSLCAYVCGANGKVYKTLNGGINWTSVTVPGTTTLFRGVHFITRNYGMVAGDNKVYKTTNGGLSWNLRNTGIDVNTSFNDIWLIDQDIAYVGGTFGKLYKTLDGAGIWNPIYPAITINAGIEEMDWQTDSVGYFAMSNSQSITLNGGSVIGTLSTACLANNGGIDAICITDNNYGYCTGGISRVLHTFKPEGIIETYLQDSIFCSGSRIFVGYAAEGLLLSNHIFTAQLSDASGSFAAPQNIGSYTLSLPATDPSGIITCTLPPGANGNGYRIRVICDNPSLTGPDNGYPIRIKNTIAPAVSIQDADNALYCSGETINLIASASGLGYGGTFQWTVNGSESGNTDQISLALQASPINILLNVQSSLSCANPTLVQAQRIIEPAVAPLADAGTDASICVGEAVNLGNISDPSGSYLWTPASGLDSDSISQPLASPTETTLYTLIVTNEFGCTATDSIQINVNTLPDAPIIELNGSFIIVTNGAPGTYTWYLNNEVILGSTENNLALTGLGTFTVQHTDLNGCTSEFSNALELNSVGTDELPSAPLRFNTEGIFLPRLDSDVLLTIMDAQGRVVYSRTLNIGESNSFLSLNKLPKALYWVRLDGKSLHLVGTWLVFN